MSDGSLFDMAAYEKHGQSMQRLRQLAAMERAALIERVQELEANPAPMKAVRNIFDAENGDRYEPEPPLEEHVRNLAQQLQYLQERVGRLEAAAYGSRNLDETPF